MELRSAIISGRAGVAVLFDGESFFSFCVESPHELRPRRPAELRLLFGEAADLEVHENVSHQDAARALEAAFSRASALDLALITFDRSLSEQLRDDAAAELDRMLADDGVSAHLENLLYAHELPEGSDLAGALARAEAGRPRLLSALRGLRDHQTAIRNARLAWEAIPDELFESPARREELRAAAARAGLFRRLARSNASEPDALSAEIAWSLTDVPATYPAGLASAWARSLAELQKIVGQQEIAGLEIVAAPGEADAPAAPAAVGVAEAAAPDDEKVSAAAEKPEAATPEVTPSARRHARTAYRLAFFQEAPRPVDAISTTLLSLDLATGVGGLPVGHAVEFYGPRSSGKTALARQIAHAAQAAGRNTTFIGIASTQDAVARAYEYVLVSVGSAVPTEFVGDEWRALARARELLSKGEADFIVVDNLPTTRPFGDLLYSLPNAYASLASLAAARGACLIYVTHTEPPRTPPQVFFPAVVIANDSTLAGSHASLRFRFSILPGARKWDSARGVEIQVAKNTVGHITGRTVQPFVAGGGFSPEIDILTLAQELHLVQERWGVFYYGDALLGSGRQDAVRTLQFNYEVRKRLEADIESATDSRRGQRLWGEGRPLDGPRPWQPPMDVNLPLELMPSNDPTPSRTSFTLPDNPTPSRTNFMLPNSDQQKH